MKEKLKSYLLNDQIFYGILIVLVGCLSFVLGQKSVENPVSQAKNRVEFMPNPTTANVGQDTKTTEKQNLELAVPNERQIESKPSEDIVASKNGTRYYYSSCVTVKRIKPENLISFPSVEAAKAAGYTKALNCP